MTRTARSGAPVRWGLVGAGDIVRKRVASALRDASGSEILAVSRVKPELAESFAKSVGAPRWYARAADLFADPDVDAVYIASPVHLHSAHAVGAAGAGKHVLCEKPMAMSVDECDRIIAAAHASGVRLGVAYYRHFYPVVRRIKELLASGEIGQPVLAQANAFEWLDMAPDSPRYWFLRKALAGGGPMFDFGCHRLEVLLDLFGPVRRVTSLLANVAFDREVEDTAGALLEFESGPCATLVVTHAAAAARDTLEIYGTRGSLHATVLNAGDLAIVAGDARRSEPHPPAPNLHQPLVQDFVDAVLAGREPTVTGAIGRAVAELEQRIYAGATFA